MDVESYNDLTSNDRWRVNLDWFGVNSGEGLNFVEEINDNLIIFSGETPWNPPINFCVELAKLYNVNVDMYYEEPDRDSCGKCWINSNGTSFEEEYQYLEGIYHINGFESWYEKTWGFLSKYLLDKLCKEDNSDLQEMISYCFLFLNEEEVEKLSIELEELYETFTEENLNQSL
jgi:hypothetical protein